ncbi:hypothetical protein BT63DRAFT_427057 [Microthyrium microscopicum]|uniref:Cyanovirin-N domain-containing protein n=1 Tax=Microthyrium microscopicum TaxID=703497 RepID=A0A6A6U4X3_9PEZI|nr:hypothetical protein BT63DRAFT_427057 [Microthyrium microscopicum]
MNTILNTILALTFSSTSIAAAIAPRQAAGIQFQGFTGLCDIKNPTVPTGTIINNGPLNGDGSCFDFAAPTNSFTLTNTSPFECDITIFSQSCANRQQANAGSAFVLVAAGATQSCLNPGAAGSIFNGGALSIIVQCNADISDGSGAATKA